MILTHESGPGRISLMKKNGGQKSRGTIPLSEVGAFHWPPKTTMLWVLALCCISL
jgi:hypothetical protein